ncbi:hypothetical protein BH09MYX1_BH09MYX1_67100 [soil metagenome]
MDDEAPQRASQANKPPMKRPWYLILALGICFVLGASAAFNGMVLIDVYRQPETDVSAQYADMKNDAQRAKMQSATQALLDAVHAEESRLFPLSAAELVLGMALFILAALAMVGRNGARGALVQVVIVYTAVLVGEHFATPKVRAAEMELRLTEVEADLPDGGMDPQMVALQIATQRKLIPLVQPIRLAVRGAMALLIVLALTRKRTRAFYAAIAEERNLESGS